MRILVLGAGGVGGYFGGRLVEAGADVTFFVRPARARVLDEKGLRIESRLGNLTTTVKTLSDLHESTPFDLVMIACKAYDLTAVRLIPTDRRNLDYGPISCARFCLVSI